MWPGFSVGLHWDAVRAESAGQALGKTSELEVCSTASDSLPAEGSLPDAGYKILWGLEDYCNS